MTSTQLLLVGTGIYYLIIGAAWLLALRLGLSWAKVENATWRNSAIATVLALVLPPLLLVSLFILVNVQLPYFAVIMRGLAHVLVPCLVIMALFRVPFLKAMQAWMPTLVPMGTAMVLAGFVLRPYFLEAFRAPTNAMAPTILGEHWQATCEKCGAACYGTPTTESPLENEPPLMICDRFHVTSPEKYSEEVHSADRFMIAKFYEPRRWDLVVYANPDDPSMTLMGRVVGLPGEEIVIRDGMVDADGRQLALPASLKGIKYNDGLEMHLSNAWGTPDKPAELGTDEYFVLGDFSQRALDSRIWFKGAAGHPPYAVPKSHIEGVVTNIYWPISRWREFR